MVDRDVDSGRHNVFCGLPLHAEDMACLGHSLGLEFFPGRRFRHAQFWRGRIAELDQTGYPRSRLDHRWLLRYRDLIHRFVSFVTGRPGRIENGHGQKTGRFSCMEKNGLDVSYAGSRRYRTFSDGAKTFTGAKAFPDGRNKTIDFIVIKDDDMMIPGSRPALLKWDHLSSDLRE